MDGLGIALCKKSLVDADIVAGRLVVPFDVVLPADAGYYVVASEETADARKIALFREWPLRSVAEGKGPSTSRQGAVLPRKAAGRERQQTRSSQAH
jgi:LysR family transcriptional regulator, glycine cleavage system transcriptional activator